MTFRKLTEDPNWSPSKAPVSLLLYGPQGVGKTTLAAAAFRKFAWFVTRESAMASWEHWLNANPDTAEKEDLHIPKDVFQLVDSGFNKSQHWIKKIDAFCERIAKSSLKGVVIDEGSTLLDWTDRDVKQVYGPGFESTRVIKEVLQKIVRTCADARVGLVWIAHVDQAKYHVKGAKAKEAKTTTMAGTQGELQYLHGPRMPIGTMRDAPGTGQFSAIWELTSDVDPMSEKAIKTDSDNLQRVLLTEGDHKSVRKKGGFNVPARYLIEDNDPLAMLRLCREANFNLYEE